MSRQAILRAARGASLEEVARGLPAAEQIEGQLELELPEETSEPDGLDD